MSIRMLAPVLSFWGDIITHHKFSDFAPPSGQLEGEKMKLTDILDKEILVTGYAVHKSKFNLATKLIFGNSAINTIMAESSANLKIRNPMEKFTW